MCTKAKFERDLRALNVKEKINLSRNSIEEISDERIREILDEVHVLTTIPEPIKPISDRFDQSSNQNNTPAANIQKQTNKRIFESEVNDILSVLEEDLLISDSDEEVNISQTSTQIAETVSVNKTGTVKESIEATNLKFKASNINKWSSKFKDNRLSEIKKRANRSFNKSFKQPFALPVIDFPPKKTCETFARFNPGLSYGIKKVVQTPPIPTNIVINHNYYGSRKPRPLPQKSDPKEMSRSQYRRYLKRLDKEKKSK